MWLADLGSSSNGGSNHSITKYMNIFLFPFTIIRFISIMTIILSGNCPPSDFGAATCCKNRPNARAILHCSIVWCWGTQSTRVCSGFTAIRFRRKCSMEVIAWTPSLFGRRASIMDLSSYRQRQSGMLVCRYDWHWIQVLWLCSRFNPGNIWWSWKW